MEAVTNSVVSSSLGFSRPTDSISRSTVFNVNRFNSVRFPTQVCLFSGWLNLKVPHQSFYICGMM